MRRLRSRRRIRAPTRTWRRSSSGCTRRWASAMLDYEAYCKIRDCHDRQHLTITQTARALGLHPQTVTKWLKVGQYRPRQSPPRASRLDPFKAQVLRWLDAHPYSAQQIFQRLREVGFDGGYTIVRDSVHQVRPSRRQAFLQPHLAPAE